MNKRSREYAQPFIAFVFWFGLTFLLVDLLAVIIGFVAGDWYMFCTWLRNAYGSLAFIIWAAFMEERNKVIKLEQELAELSALRLLHSLTKPKV